MIVWTMVEPNPFGDHSTLVWVVRLQEALAADPSPSGILDRAATPTDPPCLDGDDGLMAVLDATSGRLLGWTH